MAPCIKPGPFVISMMTAKPEARTLRSSARARTRWSAEQGHEAGFHDRRGVVGRGIPDLLVEDLRLGVARVAGGQDLAGDGPEVDRAVAEMGAAEQGVRGGRADPVAKLV